MRPLSSSFAALLVLLATPFCPAQPAPDPQTVLHTGANLVLIDVTVNDHGKPVHGLAQSSFHLFENGHERTIVSFDEHSAPAAPAIPSVPLPPNVYRNLPQYPAGAPVNVLLLDSLNTPIADQVNVRRQLLQYIQTAPPGTPFALFLLSANLQLLQGFTADPALLAAALQSPKAAPQTSALIALNNSANQFREDADTAEYAPVITPSQGRMNAQRAETDRFEAGAIIGQTADLSVPMTLDAMRQLARYLTGIPGRKNLIWFSDSFPIELNADLLAPDVLNAAPGAPPQGAGALQFMRNYAPQIREAGKLISAARVAVYPVFAGTPRATASLAAAHDILSTNRGLGSSHTARNDAATLASALSGQASMQDIAEQTGGQFFNVTDFKDALSSAIESGSSYYTLAYVPTAPLDGKFRSLKLRLQDAGPAPAGSAPANYDLSYRRGFYADAPDSPTPRNPGQPSPLLLAAQPGAPPATEIQFQARVLPATDPQLQGSKLPQGPAGEMAATLKGKSQTYIVDLSIDPHGLAFGESPDGSRQASVEFVLVAFNDQAKRVNYFNAAGRLSLNPAQFARVMSATIPQRLALDLPPGPISLRIVVYDSISGHAGSLELPLTVAN